MAKRLDRTDDTTARMVKLIRSGKNDVTVLKGLRALYKSKKKGLPTHERKGSRLPVFSPCSSFKTARSKSAVPTAPFMRMSAFPSEASETAVFTDVNLSGQSIISNMLKSYPFSAAIFSICFLFPVKIPEITFLTSMCLPQQC